MRRALGENAAGTMKRAFTIGVDYGTSSVRALVVDCADGRELGTRRLRLPVGRAGRAARPEGPAPRAPEPGRLRARARARRDGGARGGRGGGRASRGSAVIGIGVDTTGSTPIPVDRQNRPLALDAKWQANLAAHAWLWKDHTGADEAAAITRAAREHAPQYLAPIGGVYSSEWFWSKIWRCLKVAPDVFDAAWSWVELADFVPALLAGVDDPRRIERGRVRRGPQGPVLGRLGRAAVEGVPGPPGSEARGAPRPALRRGPRARPPGGPAVHGVGLALAPPRRHPDRDGRLRRAPGRGGRRRHGRYAREDHRHLHVRLRGPAGRRRAARRARHLRHRAGLDPAGLPRDRGGPVGGGRPAALVGRGRVRGRRGASRAALGRGGATAARRSRAWWRSTGTTATARSWWTRA